MSELHDFAASVLESWRSKHANSDGPIQVGDLLDRVFTYSMARRRLGIDVSEDYEALTLRLIAGQEDLASVTPSEAADLASVTMTEKLPDLAVLQLLRGAHITLRVGPSAAPAEAATPHPVADQAPAEKWRSPVAAVVEPIAEPLAGTTAPSCWSCSSSLPVGRNAKFCTECGADQRPPVCPRCQEQLEQQWKHCPECGARIEALA